MFKADTHPTAGDSPKPDANSINFFLNDRAKSELFGGDKPDVAKHYLIIQNDSLHIKNETLVKENAELSSERDECLEEQDKLEVNLRYMRGEMKNFVELRNMEKLITKSHASKVEALQKDREGTASILKAVLWASLANWLLALLTLGGMGALGAISPASTAATAVTLVAGLGVTLVASGLWPARLRTFRKERSDLRQRFEACDQEIKTVVDEIQKTEQSNDFIGKYIDNM